MFDECTSLQNLNISNFNTKNVKECDSMFYSCPEALKAQIKSLNIINNDKAFN